MTTCRTLSDLEISQTPDQLVIRGRKRAAVVSVVAVVLLVPFSLRIAYQNIVGNSQVAAIWDRPHNDQIAVIVILLVMDLPFLVVPVVACVVHLRKRLSPWVFDRRRKRLTRQLQSWPLADLTEVAVDVRPGLRKGGSAGVVLHFRRADVVELARFHAGGSARAYVDLTSRIAVADTLASTIGEFLQVPVRQSTASQR